MPPSKKTLERRFADATLLFWLEILQPVIKLKVKMKTIMKNTLIRDSLPYIFTELRGLEEKVHVKRQPTFQHVLEPVETKTKQALVNPASFVQQHTLRIWRKTREDSQNLLPFYGAVQSTIPGFCIHFYPG